MILDRLGIPLEIQAFFSSDNLVFDFGDSFEHFNYGLHLVPTTQYLWHSDSDVVTDVLLTHSVMEAMAYLTLNRQHHRALDNIACIAIGNYPHSLQAKWLRSKFRKQKIVFAFGNDLLGKAMDIRMMTGLRGITAPMRFENSHVVIECKGFTHNFAEEELSLHRFEKAFGFRSGFRTRKPARHLTFLQQLLDHDTS